MTDSSPARPRIRPLPKLRQLRYLIALDAWRHFGRAAEDCLVTQSTLSAGIQELEAVLGVTLVERTKRRVLMTPLGEEVVAKARQPPLSGRLSLGAIPTIGPYVLPRALPALRRRYPDLQLFLREDQTARLLAQLRGGDLDVALIALPFDTGHPAVEEDDLGDADLLMLEDGHCLRDHALTTCRLGGGRGNEVFQATGMNTLLQMVAAGMGVTLLPGIAEPYERARSDGLSFVPLAGNPMARQIALAWRRQAVRAQDYRLLGEALAPFVQPQDRGADA